MIVSTSALMFSGIKLDFKMFKRRGASRGASATAELLVLGSVLGSLVVRALDSAAADGWANYFSISPSHPGQLRFLPSAGREMSGAQSAVMLCGWGVKARWLIPLWINVLVAGKTA